jgi:hypothetical protein
MNETGGHTATYAPEGNGFLVECPHGCNLGSTAHAPDESAAAIRVKIHELATEPLVPGRETA